jgi:nucleoside-diphosphate-sugar epimerase
VSLSDNQAFVIGGSGFIGRHLKTRLQSEGIPVRSMSSNDVDLRTSGAGAELAALLEPTDTVIMCAALTPDHGRDAATLLANLAIAKETCDAILATRPTFVIYISSDAVYVDDVELLSESTCAQPTTFHGLMHLTRESMFHDTVQRAGGELLVLRPCAIYGPGDTHGSYGPNRFVRTALAEGMISLFGRGEERRDHLFVSDMCQVVMSSIRRRLTGTLNVATGKSASFIEVAELVARLAPRPVEITYLPRAVGAPISHRAVETSALRAAVQDLRATSLEEGVRQTVAEAASKRDSIG